MQPRRGLRLQMALITRKNGLKLEAGGMQDMRTGQQRKTGWKLDAGSLVGKRTGQQFKQPAKTPLGVQVHALHESHTRSRIEKRAKNKSH